ncbi:MAG TPA: fasciclin domain-containing protein, partial [Saprospiraceae bacterium]|nr:fasciclin domain-containing protein [Saprospiraceae bacterium]
GADVDGGNGTVHIIDAVVLPGETVVDVAIDNGFTTLTTAVVAAELLPALTDPAGTYTVFAPTDDAFAALPAGTLDALLMNPTGDLANILLYHVLGTQVASADVTNGAIVTPLNDANTLKLTKRSADDAIFVNQAPVSGADVDGGNGTVHIIDAVVLPGETVVDVAIDNGFTTLTTAVVAAELLPALTDPAGTYTVFAPTDDAFAALPDGTLDALLADPTGDLANILLYHVLGTQVASADVTNGAIVTPLNDANTLKLTKRSADDAIFVNQASVSGADVDGGNGTVHIIDAVVLPVETVVDVAIDNNFNTLTTAVVAAELLPALTDPAGTYTVFAPTDSAFAALGDTLNDLLADPTGNLANTLLYHVLGSTVTSDMLMDGQIVETLFTGNVLSVDLSDGVKINDSDVILANVTAANGVVHAINKVLTPDFPTSTFELQSTPLQVFPNPTTEFVNINAVEKDYQYTIFDVTGAVQQNGNLLQGSNNIRLNNLSNGTYFMKIFNNKAFKTVRLVVNR